MYMYLTSTFESLLAIEIIGRNRQAYYAKNTFLPRSKCSQLNHYLSKLDLNYKIVIWLRAQLKIEFVPFVCMRSSFGFLPVRSFAADLCSAFEEKLRKSWTVPYGSMFQWKNEASK